MSWVSANPRKHPLPRFSDNYVSEKDSRLPQVNWRVTATTVICEVSGDEVTVMVHGDGTIKCTGQKGNRGRQQKPDCPGPECPQNVRYRDKLFHEDQG